MSDNMIYVISLLGSAGDGTISSSIAVADTEARARAIAKAMMLERIARDVGKEGADPRITELAQLTGLKEGMTSEEYLQIAWILNMTIEDLWEILCDYSLYFNDDLELEIRSLAENGMDPGGFWFSLGGQ